MLSRRHFLWAGASLAGGLIIGLSVPKTKRFTHRLMKVAPLGSPAWIEIDASNRVTAFSSLTEMGQGVWSCVAQIVGEELDVDPALIEIKMAASWRAYAQPIGFYTGGSSSARRLYQSFRPVAAAARSMLVEAAADQWQVSAAECHTDAGAVHHALSGRSLHYSQLNAAAAKKSPPRSPTPKSQTSWRWLGKPTIKNDIASLTDGTAQYGMDLQLPDMLVAAVTQNPVPGAVLTSFDKNAALAQKGVVRVIELSHLELGEGKPSSGIAVVASNYWRASRGLAAARVRWQLPAISTDDLQRQLHALVAQDESFNLTAKRAAAVVDAPYVDAVYEVPLLMHAQLEPLNATVKVDRFTAEVWAPTQAQGAMQADVAKSLGLWSHAVVIHTPPVGGGFGRRLATDYGVVAARIARECKVPVKTVWSREEDSTQGRFRTLSTARLVATLDAHGHISEWQTLVASLGEYPRVGGLAKTPYEIGEQTSRYIPCAAAIRTGSWRSVDASQNVYFRECFIDECAHTADVDALEFRRMHLAGNPRALHVLERLAILSDYAAARQQKRFLGIAFSQECGSITAQAAEVVRISTGEWRISRIFVVVDCGIALNPNNIRAQLEGGILFGFSAALAEEVTYRDGRMQQLNYGHYRVLTIDAAPDIHIEILETPGVEIGGIGEAGVPLVAPAVTNALFAATGTRVRRLPLSGANLTLAQALHQK